MGIQKTGGVETQNAQPSAALETGDALTATVQKADGGTVVLKTSDGKLLNARLAENASLAQNDKVEFLVTQSGKDGLVLRIVYVEPQTAEAAFKGFSSAAENALAEALSQAGIAPDSRTLQTALALMRQNGLSPKAALFFALNRMEATPERVAAYQALTAGQGPGETLYEVAKALSSALGEPFAQGASEQSDAAHPVQQNPAAQQNPVAQANGAGQTTAQTQTQTAERLPVQAQTAAQPLAQTQAFAQQAEGVPSNIAQTQPNVMPQPGSLTPAVIQVPAQAEEAARGDQQQTQPTMQGAPQNELPVAAQNGLAGESTLPAQNESGQTVSTNLPEAHTSQVRPQANEAQGAQTQPVARQEEQPLVHNAKAAGTTPQAPAKESLGTAAQQQAEAAQAPSEMLHSAGESLKELPKRILDVFLELTGNQGGEDIKKFVSSSGGRLEALKFMAEKYDEESVRTMQPQLARAQEQAKLAQDVTRFLCYQLPVHNGEYGTAELYVYKKARGKGKIDADNASVLISIPTERFGRVETLLRTENKTLTLGFSVEKESGVGELKEGVRELRKTLSATTPYHLGEMRVSQLVERTTVETAEAVLTGGIKRNGTSIDVKI